MTSALEQIENAKDDVYESGQRRLQPYHWIDLINLPRRDPLVKGLLDRSAMSVVYGPSNSGKTFFALDIGLHIALGWRWRELKVRHGGVLYIAAEGGLGIRERLQAFQQLHQTQMGDVPFWILSVSVNLCDPKSDTDELIEEIKRLCTSSAVELIVIDTLSRVMAGGNENMPNDMGTFIGNCDRIRQETGTHVLVIHHSGKNEKAGSRGHSSLQAAVDTEIEVIKAQSSGIATATVRKQRDSTGGQTYKFRLKIFQLGEDEDGDTVTSCVVVPVRESKTPQSKALTGYVETAYEALVVVIKRKQIALDKNESDGDLNRTSITCPVEDWQTEFLARCTNGPDTKPDTHLRGFRRAKKNLQGLGKVEIQGNHARVIWEDRT